MFFAPCRLFLQSYKKSSRFPNRYTLNSTPGQKSFQAKIKSRNISSILCKKNLHRSPPRHQNSVFLQPVLPAPSTCRGEGKNTFLPPNPRNLPSHPSFPSSLSNPNLPSSPTTPSHPTTPAFFFLEKKGGLFCHFHFFH